MRRRRTPLPVARGSCGSARVVAVAMRLKRDDARNLKPESKSSSDLPTAGSALVRLLSSSGPSHRDVRRRRRQVAARASEEAARRRRGEDARGRRRRVEPAEDAGWQGSKKAIDDVLAKLKAAGLGRDAAEVRAAFATGKSEGASAMSAAAKRGPDGGADGTPSKKRLKREARASRRPDDGRVRAAAATTRAPRAPRARRATPA